jgi:hypothetical protein
MVPFKKDVIVQTPLSVVKKSQCCPRIRILKNGIDKVLNILKDDNDSNNNNNSNSTQSDEFLPSPTSTMDTITTFYSSGGFGLLPFSLSTSNNDDTIDTTSRRSSILASTNNRDAQGQRRTMSSSSRPSKKGVFFYPMVEIKDTLSHKEYTQEEKCNTFLQCDEFQNNQQREYLLISKMESLLKESYKLASYQEVFVEQERQEDEYECKCGKSSSSSPYYYYDDQAIANAYSKISKDCHIRAKEVALKNRQEVERYLHI